MIKIITRTEIEKVTGAKWSDWPTALSAIGINAMSLSGSCVTIATVINLSGRKKVEVNDIRSSESMQKKTLGNLYIVAIAAGCGILGAVTTGFVVQSWADERTAE